jgi:hypothetical protein
MAAPWIALDRDGTVHGLAALLDAALDRPDVAALCVLAADGNGFTPAAVDPHLAGCPLPLFGGVFPQVVHGREHLARGTVVIGLPVAPRLTTIRTLSDPDAPITAAVAAAIDAEAAGSTCFVFVDGLARRIGALVDALFVHHGVGVGFVGGGAGSLTLVQRPCVLTNGGLLADAAVLAQLPLASGIGVAHGWAIISDPLKVTRSDRTTIVELDYRPALDVYREVVEPAAGVRVTADDFFTVAKGHPFGIRRMDSEVVVRDPITVGDRGSLVCVGDVAQGSVVHILRGEAEALIAAARLADTRAHQALAAPTGWRLFIDCISRVLFLGDGFGAELAAVDDGVPMVGALTLGEIASSGDGMLEFYNKTAVVGRFAA